MSPTPGSDQKLSPETWALLVCAQAFLDERRIAVFREAVAACTSAERLCSAAIQHGMVGHLHRQITAQPDSSFAAFVIEPLAKLYRTSMQRNLHQATELLRLLQQLRERGVEAMPIKGPAWAEHLYGDVTLRNWVDLDIVVRYKQVPSAREALLEAGFRDLAPFAPRMIRREKRTEGELVLASADNDVLLDLHWQIGVGYAAEALRAEEMLSRAVSRPLLGRDVLGAATDDLLLVTCLHGARHRWDTVESLLALGVLVRGRFPETWPDVLAAARRAGCTRRVTISVAHAARVFGLSGPPAVDEALARDGLARAFLGSLGPDSLDRGAERSPRGELARLLWTFATEDAVGSAVEHAALRTLRPGPDDWRAVSLPPGAEWLYYALRPPRLALKWTRRLVTSGRI